VASERITAYFRSPEIDAQTHVAPLSDENAIEFDVRSLHHHSFIFIPFHVYRPQHATVGWENPDGHDIEPVLHDVTLSIPKGKLVAVVGAVGRCFFHLVFCVLMNQYCGQLTTTRL
jgi:ABC-type multidrug transport system fused ATPase/permease subunit